MLKTRYGFHKKALWESLCLLKGTPFSTGFTILTLALTLMLPTVLWIIAHTLQRELLIAQQNVGQVSLYLHRSLAEKEILETWQQVKSMPGVEFAELKTSQEGLKELEQQGLDAFLHYLPENPLPAMIKIIPNKQIKTPLELKKWALGFKQLSVVEEIQFDDNWIAQFYLMAEGIRGLYISLMIFVMIVVVLLVGNTQRYIVEHQRETLRVLKWIGASGAFIRRPFVYLGICYAIFSSIFALIGASLISNKIMLSCLEKFSGAEINLMKLTFVEQVLFIVCMAVFGGLSARICLMWQLRRID